MQDQKTTLIGITTDPETGHTTIELETDNHQREKITVAPPQGLMYPSQQSWIWKHSPVLQGVQDLNREGEEHE